MIGGLAMSRVVKYLRLPNVTGYLIAGLIAGPCCLNLMTEEHLAGFSVITEVALGFIAFSIGGEFKLDSLKKLGTRVLVITVTQAVFAVIFVAAGLFAVRAIAPDKASVPVILLLSAIATATAPAATLMVVKQYKANGIVTDTLLPVVAGDDAIGLMIFSICFSLSKVFAAHEKLTFNATVVEPIKEIVLSLLVGAVIGFLLTLCMKFFKSRANRLCLMALSVILGVSLADMLSLSSLLTCMMVGAVFANARADSIKILEGCERWTPPLFMLFFVISGADLDLSVIPNVGIIGIVYLICRSFGKYSGAFAGALVMKSDKNVRNYLGLALLPQAGVAIGMAQMVAASPELADYSAQIMTVVLSATLIYELVGPVLTKLALMKAGEIEKTERRAKKAGA